MKYIIMADGEGKRWNNYMGVPKHLIELNGERLIDRTVRLLKENDIQNIIVMASDERYKIEGTKLIPQSIREYEVDRFDLQFLNGEVCYLYGDVYYTEETMKTIVETETKDYDFFGRYGTVTSQTGKTQDEIFAVKVKDYNLFKDACIKVKEGLKNGTITVGIGWTVYKYLTNGLNEHILRGHFIQIDDETEDFDYPKDYDRWMKNKLRKEGRYYG